jgi:hypothetical protein
LIAPATAATAIAANTIPRNPYDWLATVVHQTEASARIAPTLRSMPPAMITNVIPTVTTPITDAVVRMLSMLFQVRNSPGAVAVPTIASRISTTISPRLRSSPTAARRLTRRNGGAVAGSLVTRWTPSS